MTNQQDGKPTLDEALAHFGVLGMKWGVHRVEGVARSTNKQAAKDAEEFARAKQFYGEGAGTRRKLIKAKVEGTSRRDPAYAKAFQEHLARQNSADHAAKARGERKRKDVVKGTAKTARGIRNVLNGNARYASLGVALAAGGALYAHRAGIDKVLLNAGKKKFKDLRSPTIKAGMTASEWLKAAGMNP